MIVSLPHMLRPRTVSTQPGLALDASEIESFWKVVILCELLRRDGDRAAWRLVLPQGLSPIAFWLIKVLQSQMRSQLKRAETKTERCCPRVDLGDAGASSEAQIT